MKHLILFAFLLSLCNHAADRAKKYAVVPSPSPYQSDLRTRPARRAAPLIPLHNHRYHMFGLRNQVFRDNGKSIVHDRKLAELQQNAHTIEQHLQRAEDSISTVQHDVVALRIDCNQLKRNIAIIDKNLINLFRELYAKSQQQGE